MFLFTPALRAFSRLFGEGALIVAALAITASALESCSGSEDDPAPAPTLGFFVSSTKHDGNLGGLSGADAICQTLATDAGAGDKTWHAYLSAVNDGMAVNARERIGTGPWYNANGVLLAADLTALHALIGNADLFITEKAEKVNGQWNGSNGQDGKPANEHDIMTGSDSEGNLFVGENQSTCSDWTSNMVAPGPQVGHTDGMGPNMDQSSEIFTSWNGGHAALACGVMGLALAGSAGRIYCFATD